MAVDLKVSHGWQVTAQSENVTREKCRTFLRRREATKETKYRSACEAEGWGFTPMAFGTWGGLGPSCARLLNRLLKRAAGWDEGTQRAIRLDELRQTVAIALARQIWALLEERVFVHTS